MNRPVLPTNPLGRLQLDDCGRLRHLITPDGLGRDMLEQILSTAEGFLDANEQPIKKTPLLRGRSIANLFFENSTRTRTTFEVAAERLSADVLSLSIATSSTAKGESILDTLHTLQAMQCDQFIVRHASSGAAHFIASQVAPGISVINAGDGRHGHPTQALLDALTIRRIKGDFSKLRVCVVGDLLHSRVARSEISALSQLGVGELRAIGPKTLLPDSFADLGVTLYRNFNRGIKDCDVVIMLRLQRERMGSSLLPSAAEYYRHYGLDQQRLALAHPDAIVMHPGPINRGVEIASEIADGPQSVILRQVTYGISLRMAVLAMTHSTASQETGR